MTDRIVFDHIAVATERLANAPPILTGLLGGRPLFQMDSKNFRFGHWRFKDGGRIEILEPAGTDGFLHRFLAKHGPGIHHLTFKVPNLRLACDRAEAHGYAIVGYNDSDPRWQEAFLHPKEALGLVVQLAHQAQEIKPPRLRQPPSGAENTPPAVTILGLRTRARSLQRARTQWELILQGECVEQSQSKLIYRWLDSPMQIVVEIDPSKNEGPICIEFESDRLIALPLEQHSLLGNVFAQRPRCGGPA